MADRILITKQEFEQAVKDVEAAYRDMTSFAENLDNKIQNLLAYWEGDAKVAFETQWSNISKVIKQDVPDTIQGVANIIKTVEVTFETTDSELATAINNNS